MQAEGPKARGQEGCGFRALAGFKLDKEGFLVLFRVVDGLALMRVRVYIGPVSPRLKRVPTPAQPLNDSRGLGVHLPNSLTVLTVSKQASGSTAC